LGTRSPTLIAMSQSSCLGYGFLVAQNSAPQAH
jgi:hypothetical protein